MKQVVLFFMVSVITIFSCSKDNCPQTVVGTINGGAYVTVAGTDSLTDSISGGKWTSSNTGVATVSNNGIVTGVAVGSCIISYNVTNGCSTNIATATKPITVNCPLPNPGLISGATNVDKNSTIALSETVTGGSWNCSNPSIATITNAGIVTGIAAGAIDITYTTSNACGSSTAIYPMTINCPLDNAGVITGATNVVMGSTINLTESVSGGNWSTSSDYIATINSTGEVTGRVAGNVSISYTTTNSCGTASAIFPITVATLIGKTFGGGIVGYILQPGDAGYAPSDLHGLIVAPSDQSSGIQWYNGTYILTGALDYAIGTGYTNTNMIIAAQGGCCNYAALLCRNLTIGGYTDWYLPSYGELRALYLNKSAIGGFASQTYWSSTEYNNNVSYYVDFSWYGSPYRDQKMYHYSVRAVRSF